MYRIFTGDRLIINLENQIHEVDIYRPELELVLGRGYVVGEMVYIYRGKEDNKGITKPGMYKNEEGDVIFKDPKVDKERYGVEHIKEITIDIDKILKDVNEHSENLLDNDIIEVINTNKEITQFTVNEDDDFLKRVIKEAIMAKKINLKNYVKGLPNSYDLGNLTSILKGSTKMSVTKFVVWCEILGLDWRVRVDDDGTDRIAPLEESIEYSSNS